MDFVCGVRKDLRLMMGVLTRYSRPLRQRRFHLRTCMNDSATSARIPCSNLGNLLSKTSPSIPRTWNLTMRITRCLAHPVYSANMPACLSHHAATGERNHSNWYIQIWQKQMSSPLGGESTSSPSPMTQQTMGQSSFSQIRTHQQFSTPSRNIRPGQSVKAGTRSRRYGQIGARNTWVRWSNTSNPKELNIIQPPDTLPNRTGLRSAWIARYLTWHVRCLIPQVLP